MTPFEAGCARIRQEAHAIASDTNLLVQLRNETLDLSHYDLSAAERELRQAADQVSELRKRVAGE